MNPTIEKVIYLVRHGQSVDNIKPVYQSPDSPLSEIGKKQAELIAERVSKLAFDSLISSPLQRTKETAQIISQKTNCEIDYSDLFVERIKPTSINGKLTNDEEAKKIWTEWNSSLVTENLKVEDGENFSEIIHRADQALKFLSEYRGESLVVVTHGYFIRVMTARVLLGDSLNATAFKHFQSHSNHENTGLTALRYCSGFEEGFRWKLWIYNDHAHLG